jgi:hypothetical protein
MFSIASVVSSTSRPITEITSTGSNFIYFKTTVTNQNCIHENLRIILNSAHNCYRAIGNLLSSGPPYKNLKIKILLSAFVLNGCETWPLALVMKTD